MSKKNSNNSIENDLDKVSGGKNIFKKMGNKIKNLFSKKDKLNYEIESMSDTPLLPNDDKD